MGPSRSARWVRRAQAAGAVALAVVGVGVASASCQQQPVNAPIRSLERSERMDVVCLRVTTPDPNDPARAIQLPAEPTVEANCAPVPPNTDAARAAALPYHLFALVTQSARGEIAVVDLTAGRTVDVDISTPGLNFVPVGALPTDVAVAPDGQMAFVGSAEVNKAALYGIDTRVILGNSQVALGLNERLAPSAPTLPQWPVCALPEPPGALTILRGAGGADEESVAAAGYHLAVVLPGTARSPSRLLIVDPLPFLRGAGVQGVEEGPTLARGSLAPCPVIASVELSNALPDRAPVGPRWSDGVSYVAGGVDLSSTYAPLPVRCTRDGDVGAPSLPFGGTAAAAPRGGAVARGGGFLFVADDALPIIHVFDVRTPEAPRELPPLLATSLNEPEREVTVGSLALSPVTRDFQRFLYAVERRSGSIMVFDVSEPGISPRVPLVRPHPELNPFQAPDRITFSAPVVAVEFARHDWPLSSDAFGPRAASGSGLLCNPNPNAGLAQGPFTDPGANYRADVDSNQVGLGPYRLRGVFAFATLSTGSVVALDVDDWDAPCRRPDPMRSDRQASALAVGQPEPESITDVDPYRTPLAYQTGTGAQRTPVSLDAFFPAVAPHRVRSQFIFTRSTTTGTRIPTLLATPTLVFAGSSLPVTGDDGAANPVLLPPSTPYADPNLLANPAEPNPANRVPIFSSAEVPAGTPIENAPIVVAPGVAPPNVRFSYEDPGVHFDQDWTVTYEGALPSASNRPSVVYSRDGYRTVELSNPSGFFCRAGVEDARVGAEKARAAAEAMGALGVEPPSSYVSRVGDYVQVTSELLPSADRYWLEEDPQGCWDDTGLAPGPERFNACFEAFGVPEQAAPLRDYPILEAYEDRLVLGRFGYLDGSAAGVTSRVVVGPDASNAPFLKALRCCFHKQVSFRVRAGGQWLVTSSLFGMLHRVKADPETRACQLSCDAKDRLLNARALEVPRPPSLLAQYPDRNSPLALRNPMFSFIVWGGAAPTAPAMTSTRRDYQWRFSSRGQFAPLIVPLAQGSSNVSPQSMRFIQSLGQLAVVDGAQQGLALIRLDSVALARAPYF